VDFEVSCRILGAYDGGDPSSCILVSVALLLDLFTEFGDEVLKELPVFSV
jgi:hypothetical protein